MSSAKRTASARETAVRILNNYKPKKNNLTDLMGGHIGNSAKPGQTAELLFGCARNRDTIDLVIERCAELPIRRIRRRLVNILRVGVYEIIYNPSQGEHAVVNEAVETARRLAGQRHTGFINAVLRKILRSIKNRDTAISEVNKQRLIPVGSDRGCLFDRTILENPETNSGKYLSNAYSLPAFLCEKFIEQFGCEQAEGICAAAASRPAVYVWPNTLKTDLESLAELFEKEKIDFSPVKDCRCLVLTANRSINTIPGYEQGLFYVQDITAHRAAEFVGAEPGNIIVDLCSAPGTKTIALALTMQDKGTIYATDIDADRLKLVDENAARLGIDIIKTVNYEALMSGSHNIQKADAVLLDVPCSNTGVMARRAEVRKRITPEYIKKVTKSQTGILEKAAAVFDAEKFIYSTCSVLNEENKGLIENFISKNPNFAVIKEKLTLPSRTGKGGLYNDGGYAAEIRKNAFYTVSDELKDPKVSFRT